MNNNLFRIHLLISVLLLAAPTMLADAAKILIVYFAASRSFYSFYIMWIYLEWYCVTKRFEFSGWNWWIPNLSGSFDTIHDIRKIFFLWSILPGIQIVWIKWNPQYMMTRCDESLAYCRFEYFEDWDDYVWGCKMKREERRKGKGKRNVSEFRWYSLTRWSEVREKKCMNMGNERV